MTPIDRRSFLLGSIGVGATAVLVAGCGDDTTSAGSSLGGFLIPTAPDGFVGPAVLTAGVEQRIAYVLHDGNRLLRDDAPATAEIGIFSGDDRIAGGTITRRNTGPAALPAFHMAAYYPVVFTPPVAGVYTARWLDGGDETGREFAVVEAGSAAIPQPGDPLPSVHTATVDDHRGQADLCTRPEQCPFHGTDLADALAAADTPIVLSIATPAFCQTELCGPVLEVLIEVAADRDDLTVIHSEVYVDAQADIDAGTFPGRTVDVVDRYGLTFEPVLFVAHADGTIARRLDATYDRTELEETLSLV